MCIKCVCLFVIADEDNAVSNVRVCFLLLLGLVERRAGRQKMNVHHCEYKKQQERVEM